MATNRPKLELNAGEEATVKLIRDNPAVGRSDFGPFFCYSVLSEDGTEMAFFATPEIHQVIQDQKLGKGSRFTLRKPVQKNGTKPKLEIALVGKEPPKATDDFKSTLLQSIRDAAEVVKDSGFQFSTEEMQRFATTIFIQRTKAY